MDLLRVTDVAGPLSLIASPPVLLTLAGHLPTVAEDSEDFSETLSMATTMRWIVRLVAVGLFGWASVHQRRCHHILKNLCD